VIETGGEEFDGVYLTLLIKLLIEAHNIVSKGRSKGEIK